MSDQKPNVTFGTIGTAQGNVHGGIHGVKQAAGNIAGDTYNNSPIVHGNTYSGAGAGQQYHQDNSGNLGNQINGGTFSGATFNQPIHHGPHNDNSVQAPNNQGFLNIGANSGIQNAPQHGGTQHNQLAHGNINSGAAAGQHNTFDNRGNQGTQLAGPNYGTANLGNTHDSSQHTSYKFGDNASRMVNAPVTGTVNLGDNHDNSQKIDNTGNLNVVSGSGQMTVGGNLTQNSGASRGGDSQAKENKEDPEFQKAFEEFFKKFYAKEAIADKLSRNPYPMARRGKMLIVNNEIWPNNPESNRKGTSKDRDALNELAKYIGFEAIVKDNRTVKDMKNDLEEFAIKQDWENFDAAIVCILSHGGENNSIYGTGNFKEKLEFPELLEPFSRQPNLHGKPKIFIVQACRGEKYDNKAASGDKIEFSPIKKLFSSIYGKLRGALPSGASKADSKYESQVADVLVLWATGRGFVAWRHPLFGSYFIQKLTSAIKDTNNRREHMADIMEHIIYEIKKEFQPGPPDDDHPGQCPQAFTTLDRKLYLF